MVNLNSLKASTKTLSASLKFHELVKNTKLRKIVDILLIPVGFAKLKKREKNLRTLKYDNNRQLFIVAIVKDEEQYIDEWVQYHLMIGFDKIIIYDNSDNNKIYNSLKKFIKNNTVSYQKMSGAVRQMDAYNDALNKVMKKDCYLMFLDADEFIFLKNKNINFKKKVNEVFNKNDYIGGLVINWEIFGSSHYKNKPNGLVTQNYIYRSKYNFIKNNHVKTICDPQKVAGVLNPHYPEYLEGYNAVNLELKNVYGAFNKPNKKASIRINHYFTKSKAEFMKKKSRGMADSNLQRGIKDFEIHDRNEIYDDSMKRYKKELERLLQNECK
ncbi:glycosyltransferase family 2 protein [Limosilactobacillus reuteri]|uniref:glycosyltransferase family 2 protein n=1 Tax=Limosilactobacillus reuteri TaxID=1598 RepID=UPI001E3CD89F|nr:glycosyltransferase family 2 protein [Limosilactobacillus reuteri]MCC4384124.1 glycosyltransferase family 2 protein [Limosilactobacillus reuteri]MCC4419966.1 glycosyltransferase family 2 protein [Limosilactobacillus reuteri]MCC4421296.1 glycosyltransferase family 2 protein [Limosilactobacillus reuteri]